MLFRSQGYSRLWVNGEFLRIDDLMEDEQKMEGLQISDTYLLIDRMSVSHEKDSESRLIDSAETAFYEGNGACRLVFLPSNIIYDYSTRFESDGIVFEQPNDNMFSFNSPLGACPVCEGFGKEMGIDEKLVVPNTSLSVYDGCVQCWHGEKMGMWKKEFCKRAAADKFPIFEPYYNLTRKQKDMLWHGLPSDKEKVCIDSFFKMVSENQYKIQYRVMLSRYRGKTTCPSCHGTRLKKEATWVKIGGKSICDLVEMPILNLQQWFKALKLDDNEQADRKSTRLNSSHP